MKLFRLCAIGAFLYCLGGQALAHQSSWQQIAVDSSMEITNDAGESQIINPSCAFDAVTDPASGELVPNDFHFYFKPGNPRKLMIFFNGGGACWNDATCISSLALAADPNNRPTYNPTIHNENSPQVTGGIFNQHRRHNSFSNWTQVFIPYCTGDIHVGSNDAIYQDASGVLTSPGQPVMVKHRGFDNFLAVREWLKTYYANSSHPPRKVLVTGSSAGGYGATLNFPYVKNAFPHSKVSLFSDAAAGVLSSGFVSTAFTNNHSWGVESTLPTLFAQYLGSYDAITLNQNMMTLLASAYPESRFAQYSTEYDAVQVLFLKISSMIDDGNLNPGDWALSPADYMLFGEWSARMRGSHEALDETLPNYQYFIGAGSVHTVLTDIFAEPGSSPFYEESVGRVRFKRWLTRFAEAYRFKKQSVAVEQ
ncbi:pectin acetylesterase-family hydrolase [Alteromonas lipolytica]|uniref:Pectinacetylesterase n=1 Tax=Alteromonas lipolytica TaxID=1856405 RepID=A0A1E8FJ02_9ALTE|nr:pectin acetylesterase-family hydrolase [Alteromonas lipolytica]OFI35588.1 hypothetical protein BFC17_12590 [Alteromonas lipolytica]GGF77426.1 hypothetical protein GCM10011338_32200 [Alteromonas lipolytica]